MEVSHNLSIPNMLISMLVLMVAVVGKTILFFRLWWLQKEVRILEQRLAEIPPAVVGELLVRQEFKAWHERQSALEAKTELLERRMDTIDRNGSNEAI